MDDPLIPSIKRWPSLNQFCHMPIFNEPLRQPQQLSEAQVMGPVMGPASGQRPLTTMHSQGYGQPLHPATTMPAGTSLAGSLPAGPSFQSYTPSFHPDGAAQLSTFDQVASIPAFQEPKRGTNRTCKRNSCTACKKDKKNCDRSEGAARCVHCEQKDRDCVRDMSDKRSRECVIGRIEKTRERALNAWLVLRALLDQPDDSTAVYFKVRDTFWKVNKEDLLNYVNEQSGDTALKLSKAEPPVSLRKKNLKGIKKPDLERLEKKLQTDAADELDLLVRELAKRQLLETLEV